LSFVNQGNNMSNQAKSNMLKAIINIEKSESTKLDVVVGGSNRINSVGEGLELYVKNAFANALDESDNEIVSQKLDDVFSYGGNKNNIPDAIIKFGDAIEVKKIENFTSGIPLNSSYPKDKLYANDHRITAACRDCEAERWTEKEMIYAVGVVPKRHLRQLWLIDGSCYAANKETYTRIETTISAGIHAIPDVEFSASKELGRVNRVDPLGITYLRIRGMWHIENPNKVYGTILQMNQTNLFSLAALIRQEKYASFPEEDKKSIEENNNITLQKVKISNPNNPVKRLDAMLITIVKS